MRHMQFLTSFPNFRVLTALVRPSRAPGHQRYFATKTVQ